MADSIGFSQLEDGMVIELVNESGTHHYLIQKTEIPSPTKLGSDFFHQVDAFRFIPFEVSGKNYIPRFGSTVVYIPGFPNESTIQPTNVTLEGYYKVAYIKDPDRKFNNPKVAAAKDSLIAALRELGPEGVASILKGMQEENK